MTRALFLVLGIVLGPWTVALWREQTAVAIACKLEIPGWQYRAISHGDDPKESELNKLGEEGWELVCVDRRAPISANFYFKKPK